MAIRLITQYPAQVGAPTAAYPHGVPRNVSAPSAGDGTPWEEAWVKDIYGFLSKLIDDAAIVHSGVADTALASQYLQALKVLFLQATQLESAGGTILETTSRLTKTGLEGLRIVRDSATLWTTNSGRGRHIIADDAESILAASLQKDISATWSVGAAGGGVPAAIHPIAANQMVRLFVVSKPDGTSDIAVDTSPVAANFFLDANAIAAGFSDATRYRRFAYLHINASNQLTDLINLELNPRHFMWVTPVGVTMVGLVSANRIAVNYGDEIPPSCIGKIAFDFDFAGATGRQAILTHVDQADVAATGTVFTMQTDDDKSKQSINVDFPVDTGSNLYWRISGGTLGAESTVFGWEDPGIVA